MKKIILALMLTAGMASSMFAVNLSFGAKGLAGVNAGTSVDGAAAKITSVLGEEKPQFLLGGGVYVDASLLGPVGIQIGANIGNNKVASFVGEKKVSEYSELLLDIPVMLWADLKLGPVGLGLGFGPNLSYSLGADYTFGSTTLDSDSFAVNKAIWGITAGANAKVYVKKVAVVAGATYVLDLQKKTLSPETAAEKVLTGVGFTAGDFLSLTRSVIYGNIGLEFKLF